VVGERRGGPSARVERVCGVLRAAGIEAEATDDVDAALWRKFLFIEPWGSIGAVTRSAVGVVRTLPETRALLAAAIQELFAVARARAIHLSDDAVEDTLHRLGLLPPDATSSMQRDIQAGRPSELHDQTGAAVRLAREAGVTALVHGFLYAALLPQESASRSSGVQRE
jgi:2-dehydropantoate 2-reductase